MVVPPPASIPQLKNKLFEAVKSLYVSKIPPVPKNAPKIAPPPVDKIPKLTKGWAPQAPVSAMKAPPLDPAVFKRNSIVIPPPQSVP